MGPGSASSLVLLPSIMDRCQRQEMLFGLSPDGWRVFGAKLSPESVVVGSAPTRLTGETSLGPVPFGKCLRRWSWGFRTKATSWWRRCAGLALSSVHISLRHAACGAVWLERRTQVGDSLGPGPNAISFHPFAWFPFGPVSVDPIRAESLKGGDQLSRRKSEPHACGKASDVYAKLQRSCACWAPSHVRRAGSGVSGAGDLFPLPDGLSWEL